MSGDDKTIPDIARAVLDEGLICDHCLGRQFAKLSTGLTNRERGAAIRLVLAMTADAADDDDEPMHPDLRIPERCWVCNGIFEELDLWASRAIDAIGGREYETFLVGTRLSGLLSENEELLWEAVGTDHAEPLKSEINREVGKLIASTTEKEVNFTEPDIICLLGIAEGTVQLQIKSEYICGRYQKLVRGIPQTRWYCRECKGTGCERCGFTGKMYQESVDELISVKVIEAMDSADTTFHGAGREDIDALMLGKGRPFVLEVNEPGKRMTDLKQLEQEINDYCEGKVVVSGLHFVDHQTVRNLKGARHDKVYLATISCTGVDRETLILGIGEITGMIKQRTPTRVMHRRADLVRKRTVHSAMLESFSGDSAVVRIECEAGLYVKELIFGDSGRTVPSLAGVVGADVVVAELDVVEVMDARD
ncbi:MAG: tRNA pseudouridine synthase Pus10 [Candidatus Methanogaster sp.]|nr:MAG: tRNA pseudouridine synthase Pus10 [ANME-2 cluster archaeon]